VLVVPLFVGFFAMGWAADGGGTCMAFVLPIGLLLAIGSIAATHALLAYRSEPYRPKTPFSLFSAEENSK